MKLNLALGALSTLFLFTACQSTRPYAYTTPEGDVISSPARNAADVALETNLRADLNRFGPLANASPDVGIYSQNGTVTLTGTVPSEKDRQMIDALVRNSSGVVAVNDQMQVAYPPTSTYGTPPQVYAPPPAPAAPVVTTPPIITPAQPLDYHIVGSTASDRELCDRIVDQFRRESVSPVWLQPVNVTVTDGNVYLQGRVESASEHEAILSAVQRTPGVRSVYDQLQVR